MIQSLVLTNFKCFKSLNLDLGAINVLAGMNGTGKSTVIQSLLAVRQSWEFGSLARRILMLNGPLIDLGTIGEVYCADPSTDDIGISIRDSQYPSLELHSSDVRNHSSDYSLIVGHDGDSFSESGLNLFREPFNYLHAERLGPRKVFSIATDQEHPLRVGKFGENASYILAGSLKDTAVCNTELLLESSDEKEYPTLHYQWELWMGRLFPGFNAQSEIYFPADQIRVALALQRQQTGQSVFVRPTNTGFGISFALGVIVAGLVAQPNTILMVENPEAHLHPAAQSTIGEFLARVAAGGTQVFVETHSEHVLNGIRRMVKQKVLSAEATHFIFFARPGNILEPSVTRIPVSESGDILSWPDGFFDQLDRDLNIILR